jgi:hypothetical protein
MILLSAGYPGSIRLDAKIHDGFSSAPVDSSNLRVSKDGRHPGFQTCLHKPWPIALPRCFHRSHKNNPTASILKPPAISIQTKSFAIRFTVSFSTKSIATVSKSSLHHHPQPRLTDVKSLQTRRIKQSVNCP